MRPSLATLFITVNPAPTHPVLHRCTVTNVLYILLVLSSSTPQMCVPRGQGFILLTLYPQCLGPGTEYTLNTYLPDG